MSRIKTVLFDLGNVLVRIDPGSFWKQLGFFEKEDTLPFAGKFDFWIGNYEAGHINTKVFLEGLCNVFNRRFTIDRLENVFSGIIREPVAGMLDIVRHVATERKTALASNTNEIHYNLSTIKCESLHLLHKTYLSYRLHAMKPAPDFYTAVISDQGIDPSEILFIDDSAENVDGARVAGMQAIIFKSVENLKIDLRLFQIL